MKMYHFVVHSYRETEECEGGNMKQVWVYFSLITSAWGISHKNVSNQTFPTNFMIGIATSAYQIEGGWNESGKIYVCTYRLHKTKSLVASPAN
jgi:hypothetical protein